MVPVKNPLEAAYRTMPGGVWRGFVLSTRCISHAPGRLLNGGGARAFTFLKGGTQSKQAGLTSEKAKLEFSEALCCPASHIHTLLENRQGDTNSGGTRLSPSPFDLAGTGGPHAGNADPISPPVPRVRGRFCIAGFTTCIERVCQETPGNLLFGHAVSILKLSF